MVHFNSWKLYLSLIRSGLMSGLLVIAYLLLEISVKQVFALISFGSMNVNGCSHLSCAPITTEDLQEQRPYLSGSLLYLQYPNNAWLNSFYFTLRYNLYLSLLSFELCSIWVMFNCKQHLKQNIEYFYYFRKFALV